MERSEGAPTERLVSVFLLDEKFPEFLPCMATEGDTWLTPL